MDEVKQEADSPRIRIVVVDDHPIFRDGLASMIANQPDMELIAEAGTGSDALRIVSMVKPDVLLLDLRLPDFDGVRVIEELSSLRLHTRVIVLTTYDGDVQARRALQAGAFGYLLKGALRRDLRECIRDVHSGKHRVQQEVASDLARHTVDATLTAREIQVLQLVARGCSNRLTASRLRIREDTVKAHVTSVLAKLSARDRTHAVTIALQRGFFEL